MNTFCVHFFHDYGIKALLRMHSVSILKSVKTLNTLVKMTSPHSMVTKKKYKQITTVQGSNVLTINE